MTKDIYRCVSRKIVNQNERFDIFFDTLESPSGNSIPNYLIIRPKVYNDQRIAGVCVLPQVAGRIGLMKSYRHQLDQYIWQAPAGFLEPEESVERSALRELNEETNLICPPERLISLGSVLPDAGIIEARVALFLARDCQPDDPNKDVQSEPGLGDITYFSNKELADLAFNDQATGAATLVAIYRYLSMSGGVRVEP